MANRRQSFHREKHVCLVQGPTTRKKVALFTLSAQQLHVESEVSTVGESRQTSHSLSSACSEGETRFVTPVLGHSCLESLDSKLEVRRRSGVRDSRANGGAKNSMTHAMAVRAMPGRLCR